MAVPLEDTSLLVHVPAKLWECWAQGFDSRVGKPPQGDQPEDWRSPSRGTVLTSGNPAGTFFNTAGALKHVSLELYMVSAHVVRRWHVGVDCDCAMPEVAVWTRQ